MTSQWNRDQGILSIRTGIMLLTGFSSTPSDIACTFQPENGGRMLPELSPRAKLPPA